MLFYTVEVMSDRRRLASLTLGVALVLWTAYSLVSSVFLGAGTFLEAFATRIPTLDLALRCVLTLFTLGIGLLLSRFSAGRAQSRTRDDFVKAITNQANCGFVVTDLEGAITYVNSYFAEAHGFETDELLSTRLSDLQADDQRPLALSAHSGLKHGRPFSAVEVQHAHRQGNTFPMLESGSVLRDHSGSPIALSMTAIDLRTHNDTTHALERRRALERAVSQVSSTLVSEVSVNLDTVLGILGRSVSASRSILFRMDDASGTFSVAHEWRTPGDNDRLSVQEFDTELLPWCIEQLRSGKPVFSSDARKLPAGIGADRGTLHTLGVISVLMIPIATEDRLDGFLMFDGMLTPDSITDEDVAILRAATEMLGANLARIVALRDAEAERDRAENYLHLAAAVFVALDDEGRVSMINRRGCEILEGTEEQIVGADWFASFVPAEHRDAMRAYFEGMMAGTADQNESHENEITTLKGTRKVISWQNTLIRGPGNTVVGTLSSGLDVTDVRRAENVQRVAYAIAAAANTTRDLDELYKTIHSELGHVLNTENFFIALYDRATDTISLPYFVDKEDDGRYDSFPAGRTLTAYVIRNNCPLLIDRAAGDAMIENGDVDLVGSESEIWMGVPLASQGLVIGAIVLQSYENADEFDEDDLEMLKFASGQIGASIDRRRAEDQLRFLGSIPPQISEGILVTDLDFKITYANEAIVTMYGFERGELLGETPDALNAEPLRDDTQREIRAAVAAGKTWQGVHVNRRKDGSVFDCEMVISPLSGPDGKPLSFISVQRDITDRKHAEAMLRALNTASLAMTSAEGPEDVLEQAVRTLRSSGLIADILLLDASHDTLSYAATGTDPAALLQADRLLGTAMARMKVPYRRIPALRYAIDDGHPIFVDDPATLLAESVPRGSHISPADLVHALGMTQSIVSPLMDEGVVFGICTLRSDSIRRTDVPTVTAIANQIAATWRRAKVLAELTQSLEELQLAQGQLLQAQKMEAVGRLAGGVAHDFNNLLTAITGYTDLTLLGLDDGHELRPHVQEVRKAAERASGLTRQLLAFSRRQPLAPQILALGEVVGNMNAMLRRIIGEDIELVTDVGPDLPGVKADAGQLEQVIVNMAVNARDAMSSGGRLTLKASAVEVTEDTLGECTDARPGSYVRLTVEDNGEGIPEDVRARIFEPFFTTKARGQGTGLGLAGAYGIVCQHEGWIDVDSEVGRGTAFHVHLPTCGSSADAEVIRVEKIEERAGQGEQILLVEDEDAVRDFATRALTASGYQVTAAASAEEALEFFTSGDNRYDLVFSDVVLPGKSGVTLAEELLALDPKLDILLSSGYSDEKSQWGEIQERGYDFLQKPYELTNLLDTIGRIIRPN